MIALAAILIIAAIDGLFRSFMAMTQHQAGFWAVMRGNPTWFSPWQGIILFSLILALGIYGLVDTIQHRRK